MLSHYEVRRLNYCVRLACSEGLLEQFRGLSVEAFAEYVAGQLIFHLRVGLMGDERALTVDCGPRGWWNTLRSLLGLKHRRVVRQFIARQMFPDLPASVGRTCFAWEDRGETDA